MKNTFKKYYFYYFYCFYRFWENGPSIWWSEWKALLSVFVIEVYSLLSFLLMLMVITKTDVFPNFSKLELTLLGLIPWTINHRIFMHNDNWKLWVEEFDSLPKEVNRKGKRVFWIINIAILGSLLFNFYLLSQIDWSVYNPNYGK